MGKKKIVTNAMRMLQSNKVAFDAIEYEISGEVEENFGAEVAGKTGIPMEQSFKTLVARGDKLGVMVCCVPVDKELDLKKLAAASGDKKADLIPVKELLGLTGYVRGGVSPIGMKKKYPAYMDESCMNFDRIAISAGVCGVTLMMDVKDVIQVTDAVVCNITKED